MPKYFLSWEGIEKILNGDYDSEEVNSVGISFDGESIDELEM